MERREKRRKAASKGSSVVETKTEGGKKPAKLVLKSPGALSLPVEKKVRVSSVLEDCLTAETPEEALEQLLSITTSGIASLSSLAERSLGVLCELWRRWREKGDVCSVIVRVFVDLVTSGSREWEEVRDSVREFAVQLSEHKLDTVKVLGLAALRKIALSDPQLVPKALQVAQKEIHCVHHAVRVECLNLIGQLSHDSEISLVTLEEYCSDPDPRVRAVSLHGLLLKLRSGVTLNRTAYRQACESLQDDDEAVRTVAIQLICALVQHTPEMFVPSSHKPSGPSSEVRMSDDAFARVCDLLNDVAMPVRALAAQVLGDFPSVSLELLEQTLDKKLMSHLKGVKSDHERQREQHAAGGGGSSGFDTGRAWGSSVPTLDFDPGERSLVSAGACGAFVHGLEDEYLEVRSATVAAMCQLGTRYVQFATQCVDFLVDMFNDEIQSVRLSAINSLRQVSSTVQLREDQMETVLGVLEESSAEIREAMHALLSTCQITTIPALRTTIHNLLDNLKKYPCDRESIWRCLQQLGSHHSHLVSCLVPELLNSHPFLMGKEPDVDDPAYVCILIVVFNAAAQCPTIPPLLHSHVFRHYTYLRDTLPQLIPHITVGMPSNSLHILGLPRKPTDLTGAHGFLHQVFCRAQATLPPSSPCPSSSSSPSPAHRHQVLGTCVSDLLCVGGLDDQLSDRAKCAATFLQCQILSEEVSQALSQDLLLLPSDGRLGPTHIQRSINELMKLTYCLQTVCGGLGVELVGGVRCARMTAHSLQLLLAVQLDMDTEQSKAFMDMKLKYHQRLESLKRYFTDNGLTLPPVIKPLIDVDFATMATDSLMEYLQPLITTPLFVSLSPHDLVSVEMARAVIHEPQPFSHDDHTRFVYSLALSIPVQATLYNTPRPTDVAVQLKFPDGRRLLFTPKASDFRSVSPHELRLDTAVITSHGLWTDPCQVELCLCVRLHTDVAETTCLLPSTSLESTPNSAVGPHSHSNRVHSHSEDSMEPGHCILAISDVVKINIFPQETASRSFNVFGGP